MSTIEPSDPPDVQVRHTIDDIVLASTIQALGEQATAEDEQEPVRSQRVYVQVKDQQRSVLAAEFANFGVTKPLKYYEEKTRLCTRTLKRLIADIQAGKDITKPGRRGRRPKYTPQLLKKIAQELCTKNKSLRETRKAVAIANMEAVESGGEQLPEVSVSTIARYVHDKDVMDTVEVGPLSFTKASIRGPSANDHDNKILRIKRREQLGDLIGAGYTAVFVDESHLSVGNVRSHAWGEKRP